MPVQFLIQVVSPPSCPVPPAIIGTPFEGSCTLAVVGQKFTSELVAINNCGSSVTIVDITILAFPGMTPAGITQLNTTVFYNDISWTPTTSQVGYQVMCAMAYDR